MPSIIRPRSSFAFVASALLALVAGTITVLFLAAVAHGAEAAPASAAVALPSWLATAWHLLELAAPWIVVSLIPSIIVALTPYPKAGGVIKALSVVGNILSLLTHKDSPGTLKLPLVQSVAPDAAKAPPPLAGSIGSSTALVLVFACLGLASSGCGPAGKKIAIDIGACAVGDCPAIVQVLLPDLAAAITGTAIEWAGQVAVLLAKGLDVTICSLKAVVFDLQHQAASLHAKQGAAHVGQGPPLTAEEETQLERITRGLQRAEDMFAHIALRGAVAP